MSKNQSDTGKLGIFASLVTFEKRLKKGFFLGFQKYWWVTLGWQNSKEKYTWKGNLGSPFSCAKRSDKDDNKTRLRRSKIEYGGGKQPGYQPLWKKREL